MRELLNFFSLSTSSDVPIGLTKIRNNSKINQPKIEETQKIVLSPLFKQNIEFSSKNTSNNEEPEIDCGLQWLNLIVKNKI